MQDERQVLQKELAKIQDQIAKLEEALEEKPEYGFGQKEVCTI